MKVNKIKTIDKTNADNGVGKRRARGSVKADSGNDGADVNLVPPPSSHRTRPGASTNMTWVRDRDQRAGPSSDDAGQQSTNDWSKRAEFAKATNMTQAMSSMRPENLAAVQPASLRTAC